jgi:hypothetical protein
MEERLSQQRSTGLSGRGLKVWGLAFLAVGAAGQAILQNKMLGIGSLTTQQLLQAMQQSQTTMLYATLALVLQTAQTCAVPIFAFLLTERFRASEKPLAYIGWLLGAAGISEVPYNMVMSGKLLLTGSLNPLFTMTLCAVMLYFYGLFPAKTTRDRLIKIVVTGSAVLWTLMMGMAFGPCAVLLTTVIWSLGHKPLVRNLVGAVVAIVSSVFSPFFVASPMGFLAVHLYNGELEEHKFANYLAYPAILLVIACVSNLI